MPPPLSSHTGVATSGIEEADRPNGRIELNPLAAVTGHMDTPSGPWDRTELVDFLTETTVPLRLGVRRGDGTPWIVPLWYRYRDGVLECATGANATVVGFLESDPTVSFDISTNDPPYSGVRGYGTVAIEPDEGKETLRTLLERYLGSTDSQLAKRLLRTEREEVRLRIQPKQWHSWDFTDQMAERTPTE